MASETNSPPPGKGAKGAAKTESPDWAHGLKQLYDSVVDEPLPDSFKNLLAQFDADDDASAGDDTSSTSGKSA